jgi:threonine/homoserine/homoserine lactone efflux protein
LSITYLVVDGVFLCSYGKFAQLFRQRVLENYQGLLNKLSGGLFLAAAALLGFKDVEPR